MPENKPLTGYPSIDKPWLKYYSDEAINAPLPRMTMYQYMLSNNQAHLEDVSFCYYGRQLTYRELLDKISATAGAFHTFGIRSGDVVTIMSMHTPETIIALYALNYLGAAANMIYMTLSESEIVEALNNTNSKLFLVLDAALDKVEKIRSQITIPIILLSVSSYMSAPVRIAYSLKLHRKKSDYSTFREFVNRQSSGLNMPMATDHTAPAVIVYTSGTTGEPKGVVLTNENVNAVVFQLAHSGKDYKRQETALLLLPPFFGFGIGMLHLCVCVGLKTTLWIELSAEKIVAAFKKVKPNRIAFGPSLTGPIMERVHGNLSFVLDYTGGGAEITEERERDFNDFLLKHGSSAKYTNGFGMTEFASVVCLQTNHVYKNKSVGIPLPQANVKIVDVETGRELKYGAIGEMCFSAPNTMAGYFKNTQATEKVIEVDETGIRWLHTGDLGYCDSDGFLFFCGRLKRIFPVRMADGTLYKIFPQRIEEFFESLPYVNICAVIVQNDELRLHKPIAYVSLFDSRATKKEAEYSLHKAVEKGLPTHLWPAEIFVLDSLPITANGKVDYRALEES